MARRPKALSQLPLRTLLCLYFTTGPGCWVWAARKDDWGYGVIDYDGKPWKAHRLMWLAMHGSIPGRKLVLHKCDRPACVNPDHLFLGTHTDNMADMKAKGRARSGGVSGERHGHSRLTEEIVKDIRRRCASGERPTEVGKLYGLNYRSVRRIVTREQWSHV